MIRTRHRWIKIEKKKSIKKTIQNKKIATKTFRTKFNIKIK